MSILDKYPHYKTVLALVPLEVVERDLGAKSERFEHYYALAQETIKTKRLCDVFPSEVETQRIILENFLGHWGNVSIEEVAKIALITKWLQPKNVFEFGTYNGMTTLQIALNVPPSGKVYTLDLPEDKLSSLPLGELDYFVAQKACTQFGTKTGSYFLGRKGINIIQLLEDSAEFDPEPYAGQMDLVFIDAAHDYDHKRIDSENAFRMLRKGGVILWHNYADVGCPDVTRYLHEISNERTIVNLKNTMLAVYYDHES